MLSPKRKVTLHSRVTLALKGDEYWIALFIQDNYIIVKDWKPYELLELVAWYIHNKLLLYTTNNNSLSSCVLCRPCFDVATTQMYPRTFNSLGNTLYIDLYLCKNKIDLQDYFAVLTQHFINKKYVAFGRDFRQTRIYHLTQIRN